MRAQRKVQNLALAVSLGGAVMASSSAANAATEGCEILDVGPAGCLTITATWDDLDESTLTIYSYPVQGSYVDDLGDIWQAQFTPTCDSNLSGTIIRAQEVCVKALSTCKILGSDAPVALWMVLFPTFVGGEAHAVKPICFGDYVDEVPIGPQIQALVEDEIGVDPPPVALQPGDAIVNLPMIASTEAREPISLAIDAPIAGVAEATPEYLWTFADGAAAHGPGLPYDGTSPTANPGYYVAYTYHELGTPTVRLTVTWPVTFTIPGNPPVPLDDVIQEATATTTVRAAGSELVGG